MTNIKNILNINRQKIPCLKDDIVQNLGAQILTLPRKTYISGHFHLKCLIITENNLSNVLIF